MEVHHHPHVEKKSFKEYLLEGLMIFLAVSMGFFAESLRETINKHEREQKLMEMFVEDLKNDTAKLRTVIQFTNTKKRKLDTLRKLVYAAAEKELDDTLYRKMYEIYKAWAPNASRFDPTERTLSQLEKTDAFSFISKQNISDSILSYKENNTFILSQYQMFRDYHQIKANEVAHTIFSGSLMEGYLENSKATDLPVRNKKSSLLTRDRNILELYGTKLYFVRGIMNIYLTAMEHQKDKAEKLMDLIKKEYHLENE